MKLAFSLATSYPEDIWIFARDQGVDVEIVVGRLQREKFLRPQWHNSLRTRYEWVRHIKALSDYHYAVGQIRAGDDLLPQKEKLQLFTDFCRQAWQATRELVEAAHERQKQREKL